ncbi:MarP family serine protease [Cryobacterium frigoriphilum]|uniref:MarP family serine protease n=1 Tax=Cryobacterium frigoriphilum TaxID=1259150 RepID=A0A4R8ZTQ5_9MICO|nr:MarP family serine protease [Cryobacterium frigoriphilum]TFD45156.1 MarP family serine protease [Cryobacterium frigoriphilum]
MAGSTILDLLLVLLLIVSLINGYRSGLFRSVFGILGLVAGGVAAYFVVPIVGAWVPEPEWRTPASIAAALLLIFIGLSIGGSIGSVLRRGVKAIKLGPIDRVLGGVFTAAAAALVASMVAMSVGSLGVPFLSPAIASSTVISGIDRLTPDPVKTFIAQLRSAAVNQGLPRVVDAFTGPAPEIPVFDTDNPALALAEQSVVRITGTAYSCGQSQSGTGFVVSEDRIVTNAHVVAGVTSPVIESPSGESLQGEIVYFDPVDDLAVIAVEGFSAAPLELTENLEPGSLAVADGYPFGGPFVSDPAEVLSVGSLSVADIYGQDPTPRQVYTLASDVQQGESGGPLLSDAGQVAGVIFAKSTDTANVGYALAMDEVEPVATGAAALTDPVSSGTCVRG